MSHSFESSGDEGGKQEDMRARLKHNHSQQRKKWCPLTDGVVHYIAEEMQTIFG